MSAFAGDTSVDAVIMSVPIKAYDTVYQFDVVRLKGGIYAAGYADLLGSTRMGWHADLGVLVDFARVFSPPNVISERDVPQRLNETFLRHRALDAEREAGVVRAWPLALLGHHNGHLCVDLVRHGWEDFELRGISRLRERGESSNVVSLARSRSAEPLMRAMAPFYRTTDREATREALADVPRVVAAWRGDRAREAGLATAVG